MRAVVAIAEALARLARGRLDEWIYEPRVVSFCSPIVAASASQSGLLAMVVSIALAWRPPEPGWLQISREASPAADEPNPMSGDEGTPGRVRGRLS